jgi:hypothetical protein
MAFVLPTKKIFIAFFNITRRFLLNVLPERQTMDSSYFVEEVVAGFGELCYPELRNPRHRKVTIHFDNMPIHNTKMIEVQIAFSKFKRMKHPI